MRRTLSLPHRRRCHICLSPPPNPITSLLQVLGAGHSDLIPSTDLKNGYICIPCSLAGPVGRPADLNNTLSFPSIPTTTKLADIDSENPDAGLGRMMSLKRRLTRRRSAPPKLEGNGAVETGKEDAPAEEDQEPGLGRIASLKRRLTGKGSGAIRRRRSWEDVKDAMSMAKAGEVEEGIQEKLETYGTVEEQNLQAEGDGSAEMAQEPERHLGGRLEAVRSLEGQSIDARLAGCGEVMMMENRLWKYGTTTMVM